MIIVFQIWLLNIKAKSRYSIKVLRVDKNSKFILIKLKTYYQKYDIAIKYTTAYLYKEHSFVERKWKTLVIIKDSLLIDSGLPNNFWAKAIKTANYF